MRVVVRTALSGALAVLFGLYAIHDRDVVPDGLLAVLNGWMFIRELRGMRTRERKEQVGGRR